MLDYDRPRTVGRHLRQDRLQGLRAAGGRADQHEVDRPGLPSGRRDRLGGPDPRGRAGSFQLRVRAPTGTRIVNLDGEELDREVTTITWNLEAAEKGGFAHFTLKARLAFPSPLSRANRWRRRRPQACSGPSSDEAEPWGGVPCEAPR